MEADEASKPNTSVSGTNGDVRSSLQTLNSTENEESNDQIEVPTLSQKDIMKALEVVERDSVAIAGSFTSLFSSLRSALAEVGSKTVNVILDVGVLRTSSFAFKEYSTPQSHLDYCANEELVTGNSIDHMHCFGDAAGRVQECALDAATKGNRYINSCLRLNEEIRGIDSLAAQLKILRRNVDSLDSAVDKLVRFP